MNTRHPAIARRDESVLVVVDCQERLWKVIRDHDALAARIATLLSGARALDVPVLVTEQNPGGLGPTVPEIREAAGAARVHEKKDFSCFGDSGFVAALRETDRTNLVIAGVEAHVCVAQTALDGLAAGFDVHVVADAVGTRLEHNEGIGLRRAESQGAVVSSIEGVLFDWMESCEVEPFKRVIGLLK